MGGLLDFLNTDQGRMGLGLLAAAGPRSDGAGFGQRMQEGMGSFDAYKANALKQKMLEAQMQEYEQAAQDKAQARQQAQVLRDLATKFATPAKQRIAPLMGDAETGIMPSAGRDAEPAGYDYAGFAGAMAAIDPVQSLKIKEMLKKEGPKFSTAPQYDQQGNAFILAENGEMKYLNGIKARDKLEEVRLGDKVAFRSPYSTEMQGGMPIGQTPDSKASNALGWANNAATLRGQNLTDRRARERLNFDMNGGADSGGATQMGLNKQFGKPQAGYRWKPDGSMEFIPGGPADQKAQMKTSGEGTVDSVVADLRDKYTQLNEGGGIVNDKDGALGNIGARIASTGLGQAVGGAVGTRNQTSRDNIAMTRPLLLQAIMKATGMSAKQMDSNAELKLYLATATDPTRGYQANMDALQRIEELYGGGKKDTQPTEPAKQAPAANLMEKLPTANASNKGKKIRDTTTGKVLVSNGMTWTEAP